MQITTCGQDGVNRVIIYSIQCNNHVWSTTTCKKLCGQRNPRAVQRKTYCCQKVRIQEEAGSIHKEPRDRSSKQGAQKEPGKQRERCT